MYVFTCQQDGKVLSSLEHTHSGMCLSDPMFPEVTILGLPECVSLLHSSSHSERDGT